MDCERGRFMLAVIPDTLYGRIGALLSALIVAVFLAVPNLRQKLFKSHRKERNHA